jgi:hypothetical protein
MGTAAKVAEKLAKDFDNINCVEPEQTIKNLVAQQVAMALGVMDPGAPAEVMASGSQWTKSPTDISNSLLVSIKSLGAWIG